MVLCCPYRAHRVFNDQPLLLINLYLCRMEELLQQIDAYRKEIEAIQITNAQQLEEFRIKYLGTKGIVKNLFGEMKSVPAERKKEFGQVLNEFKQFIG